MFLSTFIDFQFMWANHKTEKCNDNDREADSVIK